MTGKEITVFKGQFRMSLGKYRSLNNVNLT